jgi:hypothetical protein
MPRLAEPPAQLDQTSRLGFVRTLDSAGHDGSVLQYENDAVARTRAVILSIRAWTPPGTPSNQAADAIAHPKMPQQVNRRIQIRR